LHVVSLDQMSLSVVGLYAGRLTSFSFIAARRIGLPSRKPIVAGEEFIICFLNQRLQRNPINAGDHLQYTYDHGLNTAPKNLDFLTVFGSILYRSY